MNLDDLSLSELYKLYAAVGSEILARTWWIIVLIMFILIFLIYKKQK